MVRLRKNSKDASKYAVMVVSIDPRIAQTDQNCNASHPFFFTAKLIKEYVIGNF